MKTEMETDVLVVGAGPTGLMAANVLAREGVNFRILDKKAGPTDESRALFVLPRTLEYWQKLGLAEIAVEKSQPTTEIRLMVDGEPYGSLALGRGDEDKMPYPFSLVYEQSKSERLLYGGLQDAGGRVEWETELLELSQTEEEATAVLRHPNGLEETVTAGWVIGADGASSPVRHAVGLGFEGDTYEQGFFLADVDMGWYFGHEDLFLNLTGGAGSIAIFPMRGEGQFRIVGGIPPEFRDKVNSGKELVLEDIRRVVERSGVEARLTGSRWIATYQLHSRIIERFRVDRVFLTGDSAHLHSPAGGQGMNTGIGDAFNLGWKLALVVKGQAHESLLDSYEPERMPVARSVLKITDRTFNVEVGSDNWLLEWLRMTLVPPLLSLTGRSRRFSSMVFGFISQIRISYRESPGVAASSGNGPVQPGDRTPYGLFADGTSLYDLLRGTGYHLLLFEGKEPDPTRLEAIHEEIKELFGRYGVPVNVHQIAAENESLHERYGAKTPSLFLIRPDGHIAYRDSGADIVGLKIYLDLLFVRRVSQEEVSTGSRQEQPLR